MDGGVLRTSCTLSYVRYSPSVAQLLIRKSCRLSPGTALLTPPRHPPSWLSPAHSPGCSRPPHCRALNDMAVPLNVVIIDNDRGDSPSSYRAHALGAGAQPQGGGRWLASSTVVPGVSWLSYYHSLKSSLFIRAVLSGGRRLQPKQNDKCGVCGVFSSYHLRYG